MARRRPASPAPQSAPDLRKPKTAKPPLDPMARRTFRVSVWATIIATLSLALTVSTSIPSIFATFGGIDPAQDAARTANGYKYFEATVSTIKDGASKAKQFAQPDSPAAEYAATIAQLFDGWWARFPNGHVEPKEVRKTSDGFEICRQARGAPCNTITEISYNDDDLVVAFLLNDLPVNDYLLSPGAPYSSESLSVVPVAGLVRTDAKGSFFYLRAYNTGQQVVVVDGCSMTDPDTGGQLTESGRTQARTLKPNQQVKFYCYFPFAERGVIIKVGLTLKVEGSSVKDAFTVFQPKFR